MLVNSKSVKETQRLATKLAKECIASKPAKNAKVFALEGELGAGKTTFIKAFAKTCGVKSHITSPTFVILKTYKLPQEASQRGKQSENYKNLIHIDAYRLKDHKELIPLGVEEMLNDPQNIILIEWSERIKKILPNHYTKIHIDHAGNNERKIKYEETNLN
jgi:tRNA threonylcarbamoyladenosine biosynthesis protein TsaE